MLEVLARRGEAAVSEVASEQDVHKSTAFRLLAALEGRGLVEQAEDRARHGSRHRAAAIGDAGTAGPTAPRT